MARDALRAARPALRALVGKATMICGARFSVLTLLGLSLDGYKVAKAI